MRLEIYSSASFLLVTVNLVELLAALKMIPSLPDPLNNSLYGSLLGAILALSSLRFNGRIKTILLLASFSFSLSGLVGVFLQGSALAMAISRYLKEDVDEFIYLTLLIQVLYVLALSLVGLP